MSGPSPPSGGQPAASAPELRYQMPRSLYSAPVARSAHFDTTLTTSFAGMEQPLTWFIPGLVTGVPGLLIVLAALANIVLGVSWLPSVGRLLGPEPEQPDDDDHVWWAAGRPLA